MYSTNKEDIIRRSMSLTATLDAPVGLVWQAWTDPLELVNWWGPAGFTTTIIKMNVNEGEEWLLTLHGPDGRNYPNKAIFREVVQHKKIVYEHFNPGFLSTILFRAEGNNTILEWSSLFPTEELFEIIVKTFKADEGQKQNVEKLQAFIALKTGKI